MQRKSIMCLAVALLLAAQIRPLQATAVDAVSETQGHLQSLTASDARKRNEAARSLSTERSRLVSALITIAGKPKPAYQMYDERALSVMLLGEMRAIEAVDTLIRYIAFRPPGFTTEYSPSGEYPCVEALIKIGTPATAAFLGKVDSPPDKETLRLHVMVIQMVEGWEAGELKIRHARRGSVGGRKDYLNALSAAYRVHQFVARHDSTSPGLSDAGAVAGSRADAIKKLMDTCRSSAPLAPANVGKAAELLGELRAEEAAPLLVERILIPGRAADSDKPEIQYPAVAALVQIGYPSVRAVLESGFRKPRTQTEQRMMAYVINRVLSKRMASAAVAEWLTSNSRPAAERERLRQFAVQHFPSAVTTKR